MKPIAFIAVPHQAQPYIVYPEFMAPPEDGDRFFAGDHDLYCVHSICSVDDLRPLLKTGGGGGRQARHQALAVRRLVKQVIKDNLAEFRALTSKPTGGTT